MLAVFSFKCRSLADRAGSSFGTGAGAGVDGGGVGARWCVGVEDRAETGTGGFAAFSVSLSLPATIVCSEKHKALCVKKKEKKFNLKMQCTANSFLLFYTF